MSLKLQLFNNLLLGIVHLAVVRLLVCVAVRQDVYVNSQSTSGVIARRLSEIGISMPTYPRLLRRDCCTRERLVDKGGKPGVCRSKAGRNVDQDRGGARTRNQISCLVMRSALKSRRQSFRSVTPGATPTKLAAPRLKVMCI